MIFWGKVVNSFHQSDEIFPKALFQPVIDYFPKSIKKIIVSSRTNYVENEKKFFDNFLFFGEIEKKIIYLCDFDFNQISCFLEMKNLSLKNIELIKENENIKELIKNPFLLNILTKIITGSNKNNLQIKYKVDIYENFIEQTISNHIFKSIKSFSN